MVRVPGFLGVVEYGISEWDKRAFFMMSGVTRSYESTSCFLCTHEERYEFDRALALKEVTQVQVARQIGCSKMSVSRHFRNHLLPALGDLLARRRDRESIDIMAEVETLFWEMKDALEDLKTRPRPEKLVPRYWAELRKNLELLAKITGELETARVKVEINTEVTQQILQVNALILAALKPFPEAKAAVVKALRVDE
ncbi:MAG: hypothetical protein ACC700_13670 [Anaerolineales bacterium]